jgi:RNA polymerase sigma-70 factor (ECF subfamily)
MDVAALRALLDAGQVDHACRLLHDTYGGEVTRFVRARRPADAADVTQEIWAAVARTLPGFRFEATPRGWILTIARRKVTDAWREDEPVTGLDDELTDDAAVVELTASSPRSQALRAERRAAVQRALATLDEGERELLELRYVTGLKPAEIGDILDERANTVSQRLVRALRRLREALIADELFASQRGA